MDSYRMCQSGHYMLARSRQWWFSVFLRCIIRCCVARAIIRNSIGGQIFVALLLDSLVACYLLSIMDFTVVKCNFGFGFGFHSATSSALQPLLQFYLPTCQVKWAISGWWLVSVSWPVTRAHQVSCTCGFISIEGIFQLCQRGLGFSQAYLLRLGV